jgi:tRNA pseudouridine55 synthase
VIAAAAAPRGVRAAAPGPPIDGALVIDKPVGITSHDVVAAVRRVLGGVRAGHTGTLDPLATGVLPLLLGRATRLAQFHAGAPKSYEATIRFGWSTDTYDAGGRPLGVEVPATPERRRLEDALPRFCGTFAQRPPAFSAKKIAGRRAYALAREDAAPELAPVEVTVYAMDLLTLDGSSAVVAVRASAGFYVRALAQDLGEALGCGAHLAALRRVKSGTFAIADAVPLDEVLRDPALARSRVIDTGALLPEWPAVNLDGQRMARACRGQSVPLDDPEAAMCAGARWVRLLAPDGSLVALASPTEDSATAGRPAVLHPSVVLR